MGISGDIVLPSNENEYDAIVKAPPSELNASKYVAAKRDPARWAKVLRISEDTKLPPDLVDRQFDQLQEVHAREKSGNDYDKLVTGTPGLSEWLKNPDNATIGREEIAQLARVSHGAKAIAQKPNSGFRGAISSGLSDLNATAGTFAAVFGRGDPQRIAEEVAASNKRSREIRDQAPDYVKDFQAAMQAHGNDVNKALQAFRASQSGYDRNDITRILNGFRTGQLALGEVLQQIGSAVAHARGLAYEVVQGFPSSVPMLAGGAIGAGIGNVPGLIGGTLIGGEIPAVAAELNASLEAKGIDITNPEALAKAYSDPQLMASLREKASRKGITSSMVNALISPLGGRFAGQAERAGAGAAVKTAAKAADVAVQAGGVGAGELAGEKAAGEKLDIGKAIQTTIATLGYAVGAEAVGVSRRGLHNTDPVRAATEVAGEAERAIEAQRTVQALSDIGTAVSEAKTTQQVPDRLKSLVDMATGQDENALVYFQPQDWDEHFQSVGSSPAKAVADILGDDGKAYYDAKATDSPIVIPLSDYVARVATTQHWEPLLEVARTQPDGMTLREATDYLKSLPKTMEEIAGEAQTVQPEKQSIRENIIEQARGAGRSKAEAEAIGDIYQAAFTTLGKRSGIDPQLLFERYRLRIERGEEGVAKVLALEPRRFRTIDIGGKTVEELTPAERTAAKRRLIEKREAMQTAPRENSIVTPEMREQNLANVEHDLNLLTETKPDFGTPPEGIPERRSLTAENEAARAAYAAVAQEIRDFPAERRQMLRNAFSQKPDLLQLKQEARGRFLISPETRQAAIDLFKPANRSTLLHETGHFYYEVLRDVSGLPDAPAEIVQDFQTLRDWVGAQGDKPLTTAQHEQFARGFEAYLMEGKAPSQALRTAFYRFKRWLLNIYKEVSTLSADLTPEVRRVFDRLLAVDEEIARAEESPSGRPLFDDPRTLGMTEQEAANYQLAVQEAHQAAEEALTAKMMKQIQREESAQWKEWRDPIEKEVTDEINKRPEYRALSFLKDGTNPDGSPLPEGTPQFKLSRQSVKESYGLEVAQKLPRGVTGKDGIHPDLLAESLGFKSGRELLDAISNAPKKEALIKSQTDARMQLAHGERLTESQVRESAQEAVQSKKGLLLRKELEFLASDHLASLKGLVRKITRAIPPTQEVRDQASRIVASKSVRDLRPYVYERAAQNLANQAREALLKGDVQAAFDLKRKELLTNEVFNAATAAKDAVDKGLEEFKKVFRKDDQLSKTRDLDLVNAARAILATFGIGKSEKPAFAYLEQMKRFDPEMYETINQMVTEATTAAPVGSDYRSLSYQDFAALRETVGSLWKLSRRNRQIEIDGQKLDRAQVQDELTARITALGIPEEKAGYDKAVTKWEKTKRSLMTARSWLRRVEHWVDAMDQGNPEGPFRRYVWNPISEGVAKYRVEKRGVLQKYLEIVKPVEKGIRGGNIPAPELGYTFEGKAELLGALLHRGNESNLSKLLRGRNWGEVDEEGTLNTSRWDAFERRMQTEGVLTKADYDYAQGVWDLFEELKPQAQKAHNEMYGHYFNEITAQPFNTPFGKYKGGYVPAKADPFLVPDAQIKREANSLTEGADNSFMFPTTGRGFTKSRVEAYARPLIMNAAFVPSQLDAVLRFTHIEPRVKDVGRVVVNREFRNTLDQFDPTVGGDMLVPWLQRVAMQRVDLPGKFPMLDRFFKELRTRTGLQIMTANVVNSLQQFTGLSISMTKVEPRRMASALWQYVRDPKGTSAAIAEKSPFMSTRMTATVMEVQKVIDNIMLDPSKYDKLRNFTREHGYFLASGTQSIVDHVTWMGKYDEAISRGLPDKEAVREADSAVRETQGSFAPEDVSRAEAQTPFVRAFLQFYGYFNMQANLLGTEFLNISRNLGLKKGAGKLLFAYTVGFAIPSILSEALVSAVSNRPFDDDDDGPIDDVFSLFFGSQVRSASRLVPIVGQLSDVVIGQFTKQTYDDSIRLSPAVSTLEKALAVPADVYKAIRDQEVTKKGITDFLTLVGLLTGLPTAPLAKPVNYLRDVQEGNTEPENAYDYARGLVTGH